MSPTPVRAGARGASESVRTPAGGSDPDPVAELRFTVKLPNVTIGTFRECSGIQVELQTEPYEEGGNNDFVHVLPVRLKFQNLTLKRGITHQKALIQWFNESRSAGISSKWGEVQVALVDARGRPVQTWAFKEAYPVKWVGPTLNASSNQVATETLEIAHAGMTVV